MDRPRRDREVTGDGSAELLDHGSLQVEFAYQQSEEGILRAGGFFNKLLKKDVIIMVAGMQKASRGLTHYYAFRRAVHEVLIVVFVIRFPLAMSLVAAFAIYFPDQIAELLRMMAEEAERSHWRIMIFFSALLFLCLSAWYWGRASVHALRPGSIEERSVRGWAARNIPRIAGILPAVATALAFVFAEVPGTGAIQDSTQSTLRLLGLGSFVLAVALFVLLVYRSRLFCLTRPQEGQYGLVPWHLGKVALIALASSSALGLSSLVIFTLWPVSLAPLLGGGALIFIWAGTLIPLGSVLAYLGTVIRVPILGLLLLSAFAYSHFDLNDNHAIRHQSGVREGIPPEFGRAFGEWLASRADLHLYDPYPVFFVAAEGGGIRAAYFTAQVLAAIQDHCPAFAQHVFGVSGVSGGSLGAAVFAALAKRNAVNLPDPPCAMPSADSIGARGSWQRQADAALNRDLFAPLLASLLYPDLFQRFLPFPVPAFDRARTLERSFERAWTDATGGKEFEQSFYDLWADFSREATPALLLNTTSVETGLPMIVSSLYLLDERFGNVLTLADLDWSRDLPLSTAVGMSARFPLVTPALLHHFVARRIRQSPTKGEGRVAWV